MYRYTIALTLLMAWGCQQNSQNSSQADVDDHGHSGENSQFTLFSGNTEFFIEHELLEAGEESEFLVHLTHLDSYKPYTSGSVSIQIDGVSVTSDGPDRPGIFLVPFTPKKAGAFDLKVSILSEGTEESVSAHIHVEDHEGADAYAPEELLMRQHPLGKLPI